MYPSFTGSGTAAADTVTVTIEADPVAPWSDGTPPLGDSREETFNAPTEQCPAEDGEIIVDEGDESRIGGGVLLHRLLA